MRPQEGSPGTNLIPLHRYPVPDQSWLTDIPASLAADTLSYLLAAALDHLDWFADEEVDVVQAIIHLASDLVDTITEESDDLPALSFPTDKTLQAVCHIAEAADRIERHKTYNACKETYDDVAFRLVAGMRQATYGLLTAANAR
jgi:hypothetical protein